MVHDSVRPVARDRPRLEPPDGPPAVGIHIRIELFGYHILLGPHLLFGVVGRRRMRFSTTRNCIGKATAKRQDFGTAK